MLVVIDTNIIVSIYLTPSGAAANVLDLLEHGRCRLLISPAIEAEYQRVMRYPHIRRLHRKSDAEIDLFVTRLSRIAVHVAPSQRLEVVYDDPDDNKFVECAVEGHARYIVSGDKHLLRLGSYEQIEILPPADFVRLLTDEYPRNPLLP